MISSGLSYSKESLLIKTGDMIRVLRDGNISIDGAVMCKDDDVFIPKKFVDCRLLLENGDVIMPVVTSLENVGKSAVVRNADGQTVCGGFVYFIRPVDGRCLLILPALLQSKMCRDFVRKNVKKSCQAFYNMSKTRLMRMVLPLPPLNEQGRIVKMVDDLLGRVKRLEEYTDD